jgi:hypothetical protein
MDHYRSHFLNAASRIIGTANFPASNMPAAIGAARRLSTDHEYRVAAELWRDNQYVGCVLRGDPAVESEPGEGARVTIALPLAAHENVDAKNANGAESIRAVA